MINQNTLSLMKIRSLSKEQLLKINSPKLKKYKTTLKTHSSSKLLINLYSFPKIIDYRPFIKMDKKILTRKITNILKDDLNIEEKKKEKVFISKNNLKKSFSKERFCFNLKNNFNNKENLKLEKKKINFENFKKKIEITKRYSTIKHIVTKKKFKKDLEIFFLNENKFNTKKERISFIIINNNKLEILKYGIFSVKYDCLKKNIKAGINQIKKNKKTFKNEKNLFLYNIYGKLIYDENTDLFKNLKEKHNLTFFQKNNFNFDKFSQNIFFLTNQKTEKDFSTFLQTNSNFENYNNFLIIFLKTFEKFCFIKNKIKFNNKLIKTARIILKKNFKTPNFSSNKLKKLYTTLKLKTFLKPSLKSFKSKFKNEEKFVKSMNLKKIQKQYLESEETLFKNPKNDKIFKIDQYYENLIKFLPNDKEVDQIEDFKSWLKR